MKIGITQGDVNGIGYEVIMKALQDMEIIEDLTPIIYGSPKAAAYHRKACPEGTPHRKDSGGNHRR